VVRALAQRNTIDPGQAFVRFSLNGAQIDTITITGRTPPKGKEWIVMDGKRMVMSRIVPLRPAEYAAFDPTGGVLMGWTGEYQVLTSHNGKDTTAIFGRAGAPATV